jgi:hypothetical protein
MRENGPQTCCCLTFTLLPTHLCVLPKPQDASFFDHNNEAGMAKRQEALIAALDDMLDWLEKGEMMSTLVQASKPLSLPLPFVQCEKI